MLATERYGFEEKMEIKDTVTVITGSSAGIGRATALRFAREGAKLVINSRSNIKGGEEVVAKIRELGTEAIYVQADLSEPNQVKSLFDQTLSAFGTVDILINNAGTTIGAGPFLETTKEDWLKAFTHNVITAVLCSKEASKIMLGKGRGKIINTSSVRGLENTGREGIMAYSAAKAALINFTKTLAKELAPAITVNAIAPGFVSSPSYDAMPRELRDDFINATQIKRFISPQEIADAFLFLANADALTGEVLVIDGGFTLK